MTYYNVCPYCGNNLDPGEKCDCREHEEEIKKVMQTEKSGQMVMIF